MNFSAQVVVEQPVKSASPKSTNVEEAQTGRDKLNLLQNRTYR